MIKIFKNVKYVKRKKSLSNGPNTKDIKSFPGHKLKLYKLNICATQSHRP